MAKKRELGTVTVLVGESHLRVLNKERVVIDNQISLHFLINNGGLDNMLANGNDGIVVTPAGVRRPGQVTWADLRDAPKKVKRLVGSRGLEFLQALVDQGDHSAIEELQIVSSWQIRIVPFREKWISPDKFVLPVLRKVLGKRLVIERWNVPDSEVVQP